MLLREIAVVDRLMKTDLYNVISRKRWEALG